MLSRKLALGGIALRVLASAWFFVNRTLRPQLAEREVARSSEAVDSVDPKSGVGADLVGREPVPAPPVSELPRDVPSVVGDAEWKPYTTAGWKLIGSLQREPVPRHEFEQRYPPDMGQAELAEAHLAVVQAMQQEIDSAAADRRRLGLVEVVPAPPKGPDGFSVRDWLQTTASDPIYSTRWGDAVGPDKVEIVWLPFEEYPQIYDLRDEWGYLGSRVIKTKPSVKVTRTTTPP